jgi:molecular chaperone DnaK (HSP70)
MNEEIDEFIINYFSSNSTNTNNNVEIVEQNNKIEENKKQEIIIGIDLGTTNSCVGIWRNKNLEIIPDEYGNRTIPSMVAFSNKSRYVGQTAKNQFDINARNVIYEVKRLIGREYTDQTVQNDLDYLTYRISSDEKNNIAIHLENGKKYSCEMISSMILTKCKTMAENYLNQEIKKAVITVPAYFNDVQRQATKDSATIAGLECVRIINEPTSAALAYGLINSTKNTCKHIIVYDYGGGTLDVSLLRIYDGIFEVLASVGNTHLGGSDFDNKLISYCIQKFKEEELQELKEDSIEISILSLQKLRKECELAKILLSDNEVVNININDFYTLSYGNNINLNLTITREEFITICSDLIAISIKPLEDILLSCELNKSDIDDIILVGGMTRMPIIRENIKNYFNGKEPNCSINPDEAIAAGAAIQAYIMSHEDDPFSESITLLDIIPLSLGIETYSELMDVIVERNTTIPVSTKKLYTTDTDNMTEINIRIFEGERKLTKDNFLIGEFTLEGIKEMPRSMPKIEVKFDIDINGIITVTARDITTNIKNTIKITGKRRQLSLEDINALIQEAKEYDFKDKIDKLKKQLYCHLLDICDNIKDNLKDGENKEKEQILEIVNQNLLWLKECRYSDRTEQEYSERIKYFTDTYSILILKANKENNNFKEKEENSGTSVYDEDEEENILNIKSISKKQENIDEVREELVNLCNEMSDILREINIEEEDMNELRDIIDDTMLWIYVESKITKNDFVLKINEINDLSNKIIEKYNDNVFRSNSKEELLKLCLELENLLDLDYEEYQEIKNKIEFIRNIEEEYSDEYYLNLTEELNNICKEVYEKTEKEENIEIRFNFEDIQGSCIRK